MSFNEGDLVFFFHPKHSWIVGNVKAVNKEMYTCQAADPGRGVNGETLDKLNGEKLTTCREDLLGEDTNDLLTLTILHDATLLRCLFLRYMKDVIYTNIGAIVVALNPFNFKIPWYMDDQMKNYLAEGEKIEKNLPHSWAQAHNTYNEMVADKENQCVLISGESGAGKTEATKIVMKYLACISINKGTEEQKQAGMQVGVKLSRCSPFLEAFGNAKTVRNDNSSRFGKFMKIKFGLDNRLVGAFTIKYLLEKSRIITASKGERVYHAFYIAVRGKFAQKFGLAGDTEYKSINAGGVLNNPDFNTAKDFEEVIDAMALVGMSETEIDAVWRSTSAILSALNIAFVQDGEGSKFDEKSQPFHEKAVELLKVDSAELKKELLTTTIVLKGETTVKVLNIPAAIDGRDAFAKATYDSIFGWLVEKSNQSCDVPDTGGNWIGLLDIFGFEDFEYNSFEQICINLANETLQNHYNTYIFSKDMDECRAEGIDVTAVTCPDNGPCLSLVSGKGGILAALDEECMITTGTDLGFLEKISKSFATHQFFEKKKLAKSSFIVKHYAGNVSYEVAGWLEKNKDNLKDSIKLIMRNSACGFVKELLPEPLGPDAKKVKVTVGSFFKGQVQALMDLINSTNPHWIRCVKPHPAKKPLMFDGITTMNQLESSGVLGTVKVRKAGYPIRLLFEKFYKRYGIITPNKSDNPRDFCVNILKSADLYRPEMAQVGKTKVFMKSEGYPLMERKRNECLMKYTTLAQRAGQGYMSRVSSGGEYWTMKVLQAAKCIQAEFRDWMTRTAPIRAERARVRAEKERKLRLERAEFEDMEDEARTILWEDEMMAPLMEMIAIFTSEMHKFVRQQMEHLQKVETNVRKEMEELEDKERRNYQIEYNKATSLAGLFEIIRQEKILREQVKYDQLAEVSPIAVDHIAMLRFHQEQVESKFRKEIMAQENRLINTLRQSSTIRWCSLRMEEEQNYEEVWRTHIEECEALQHLFHVKFDLDARMHFLQHESGTYSEPNYRKLIMYEEFLSRKQMAFFLCFIQLGRQEIRLRNALQQLVDFNYMEMKKRHQLQLSHLKEYRNLWNQYEPIALDIKERVYVRQLRIERRDKKIQRLRHLRGQEQESLDLASDDIVTEAREREIRLIRALQEASEENIMKYGLGSLWTQYTQIQTGGEEALRRLTFNQLVKKRQELSAFADYSSKLEPNTPLWASLLQQQREMHQDLQFIADRHSKAREELEKQHVSPPLTRQILSSVRSDVRSPDPVTTGQYRLSYATEASPLQRSVRTPSSPSYLRPHPQASPMHAAPDKASNPQTGGSAYDDRSPSSQSILKHKSRMEAAGAEEMSLMEMHLQLQKELQAQRQTELNTRMAQQIVEDQQDKELMLLHRKLQNFMQ
eukprot:PhF_6_TR36135/c0_g1_i1/m.52482/K10357/MYO5; myosin V